MPTIPELRSITDSCDDGRRGLRSDAPDPGETLTGLITSKDPFNLTIEPLHTGIELAEHVEELFEDRRKEITEPITLSGAERKIADRTYLICEDYRPSPFWPFYERYVDDPAWRTARLPSLHDAMIMIPDVLAQHLRDTAARVAA